MAARAAAVTIACIGALMWAQPVSGAAPELPNLVALPVFDLRIESSDEARNVPALRFSVATANRGDFALDLFGEPESAGDRSAIAHQCVEWITDRACGARTEVGRFSWHPDHGHMHLEGFALYELRRFRSDGTVRMSDEGLVATSGKISYCVIDVEPDRPAESPLYSAPHPLYYSCFVGGFQGISPGWRDVYSWRTIGQQFLLDGLGDERYALVVTADPDNILLESSDADNRSVTGIELWDGKTKVRAFCEAERPTDPCLPSD